MERAGQGEDGTRGRQVLSCTDCDVQRQWNGECVWRCCWLIAAGWMVGGLGGRSSDVRAELCGERVKYCRCRGVRLLRCARYTPLTRSSGAQDGYKQTTRHTPTLWQTGTQHTALVESHIRVLNPHCRQNYRSIAADRLPRGPLLAAFMPPLVPFMCSAGR